MMYTVRDHLNERYNDKYVVDVWQPTHAEAMSWGARVVEVEIVSLP
jgi:3D (Asp-Asp-Asp) domain-containing protein